MKRIKALVSAGLIIAACLNGSTVFAQSNTLDIDAVLNSAIETSNVVKSIDISIKKAQNTYDKAVKDATNYDDQLNDVTDDAKKLQLIQSRDDSPAEAKNTIYQYNNAKEVAKNQVNLNIYQQYIMLLDAKDTMDIEQNRLNNAEADYKKVQIQSDLGMALKKDVLTKQSIYLAEKTKFNTAERQYRLQTMKLNQLIGVPIYTQYDTLLKDKITENPYIKTYNEYLSDALKNRAEILDYTQNVNLKKFTFETIKGVYPYKTQEQYKNGQYYFAEAQNALEDAKINISLEINAYYNNLQNKYKQLQSQKENFDYVKKSYDQTLQKYNLGIISKMDLDTKYVSLQDAQNQLKALERDIWLAQTQLNYACGIGADTSKIPNGNSSSNR